MMKSKESCLAVPMMPSVTDLSRAALATTKFAPKCGRIDCHQKLLLEPRWSSVVFAMQLAFVVNF
jgi:hypothetical protein